MKARRILAVVLAGLIGTAGYFLIRWQTAESRIGVMVGAGPASARDPATKARGSTSAATSAGPGTADENRRGAPHAALKLPPANVPLVSVMNELQADAAQGNYRAACRLATEFMRCKILEYQPARLNKLEEQLKGMDPGAKDYQGLAASLENARAKFARDREVCAGFDVSQTKDAWRYLFQAAMDGHVPSKAMFATSPPWNPFDFIANVDAWYAYKHHAPRFLLEAANAGHKGALGALARAYAGEDEFMGGVPLGGIRLVEPDAYLAAVYAHAAIRTVQGQSEGNAIRRLLERVSARLTPAQAAAAKVQAESLVASWPADAHDYWTRRDPEASKKRSYDEICEY